MMICTSTLSKATMSDERLCYDKGESTMKGTLRAVCGCPKRYSGEVEQE